MSKIKWPDKYILDGTAEDESEFTKAILDSLTESEEAEAMSDKYAYLDD